MNRFEVLEEAFQIEIRGLLILLFLQIYMLFFCMPQLSQPR